MPKIVFLVFMFCVVNLPLWAREFYSPYTPAGTLATPPIFLKYCGDEGNSTARDFASVQIYRSYLEPGDFGCAKASRFEANKLSHISNIRQLICFKSRELSRQPKTQVLNTIGISLPVGKENYFTERVGRGLPGDYIVSKQPGCYCLLILRAKEGHKIVLEEIDVPEYAIDPKTIDWKTWLLSKAPGNSSWGMISIDLEKQELLEAYSVSKSTFLTLSKEEQFFLSLLNLASEKLTNQNRRKIGPPPLPQEEDRRSIWQPRVNFEGKIQKSRTSVYRSVWPKDGSILSDCKIDFYFDELLFDFPFPIWIDIYGGYFQAGLAVVEAGRGIVSPALDMPKRSVIN